MRVVSTCTLFVVMLVGFATLLSCTSTPDIPATDGRQSVATVRYVELNGVRQFISIRGSDTRKPLLLVLHGGPGTAVLPPEPHI